jgi:hypothetical protein
VLHRHRHHPETVAEKIDALMAAVMSADARERSQQIGEQVALNFVYISPGGVFDGVDGLSEAFTALRQDAWRHVTVRRTTDVDVHHEQFRYAWERREGSVTVMEGWSFGTLNAEGKITRIVSFDGLIPGQHDRSADE